MTPETHIHDPFVLADDVVITPISELAERVRHRIDREADFAVSRIRSRSSSALVDESSAKLLDEFRRPSTIVSAVIRFSQRRGLDAEAVLGDAYPVLRRFITAGHLVSTRSRPHQPSFSSGQQVAAGRVVRCLSVLEDTEIYQIALDDGGLAALKVLRPQRGATVAARALVREAEALSHIDGRVAPRLLDTGKTGGDMWLSMEWCDGSVANSAAAALRRMGKSEDLFALCSAIVDAYVALHDLGVVHGDVHPGNILVRQSGAVQLIDFGLAHVGFHPDQESEVPRGGVHGFFDPEYAEAVLARTAVPPASFASDQYSMGAVLYQLVTGEGYRDFSLDRNEMLRQIRDDHPLPFTRHGLPSWPDLEAVLNQALAKDPPGRFTSMSAFAVRLAEIEPTIAAVHGRALRHSVSLEALLTSVVNCASPGGAWFEKGLPGAPLCSVAYGAAGLAAALCHVGVLRSDPELVALADEWAVRAARGAHDEDAFRDRELDIDERRTGLVSPFHRLSGVHAVQAIVSHAMGDELVRQQAVSSFVKESQHPCTNLDVTLGTSGTVLVSALLLEFIDTPTLTELTALKRLGDKTIADIWQAVDDMPPIERDGGPGLRYLGIAHGWAGVLLATLRWCRITGEPLPSELEARLQQLAGLACTRGIGAQWPKQLDPTTSREAVPMSGWCHGSAGFVHLWTTAHKAFGDDRWATLAEQAAWDAYATRTGVAQLCCGLAGQAYGLLEMYRHSGETRWLTCAGELAERAAGRAGGPEGARLAASLHKGDLGIAVLASDLAEPEAAAMPFFGAQR